MSSATNLTNRNSKDSAALVADAIHAASLRDLCAAQGGDACDEAAQVSTITLIMDFNCQPLLELTVRYCL